MYDFLCDPHIISDLLQNNIHLFLKRNILSLKNFFEIKEGKLILCLKEIYNEGFSHIMACKVEISHIKFLNKNFRFANEKE